MFLLLVVAASTVGSVAALMPFSFVLLFVTVGYSSRVTLFDS